jgi:hypothetical protein
LDAIPLTEPGLGDEITLAQKPENCALNMVDR